MTYEIATQLTKELYTAAAPVLRVTGYDKTQPRWCRNVAPDDDRRGPWHVPQYQVLDQGIWDQRAPCIYLVNGSDGGHRYAGISKNRLKDRWRLSPAHDETESRPLGVKHLFHSRCWPETEKEFERKPALTFEDRVALLPAIRTLPSPAQEVAIPSLSGLPDEEVPGVVENWPRQYRRVTLSGAFLPWNKN